MKTPTQRKSVTLAGLLALISLAIAAALQGQLPGSGLGNGSTPTVRAQVIPVATTERPPVVRHSVGEGGNAQFAQISSMTANGVTDSGRAPVSIAQSARAASASRSAPAAYPGLSTEAVKALALIDGQLETLPWATAAAMAAAAGTPARPTLQLTATAQSTPTRAPTPRVAPLAGAPKGASAAPVAAVPTVRPNAGSARAAPKVAQKAAATAAPAAPVPIAPAPVTPAVPSRIVAKSIRLDVEIIPVGWREVTNRDGSKSAEWIVASYAASWHKTSARLGEAGNTVVTGHNNIVGEVFRHLEDLKIGDPVTIYGGAQAFQYKVAEKFTVQEVGVPFAERLENARWIEHFEDERVTLMSCWPYTGDTHRIFVILRPAR